MQLVVNYTLYFHLRGLKIDGQSSLLLSPVPNPVICLSSSLQIYRSLCCLPKSPSHSSIIRQESAIHSAIHNSSHPSEVPRMRILLWLAQNIKTITFLSGLILINNLLLSRTRRKKRTIQSPEHILIVGASSGVGEAIALHYAKLRGKNVSLFLTARRAPNEVCKRVNDIGAKQSMAAMTDATDPNDLLQLYSKINKEWKAVDTIILWFVHDVV